MKNNMRVMLYALAAGLAFILWQRWIVANTPEAPPASPTRQQTVDIHPETVPAQETGAFVAAADGDVVTAGERLIRVQTDVLDLIISTRGATIVQGSLSEYPTSLKDREPLALIRRNNPSRMLLSSGLVDAVNGADQSPTHTAAWHSAKDSYVLAEGEDTLSVPFTWQNEHGVSVSKTFIFRRGEYRFDLQQELVNNSEKNWEGIAYSELAFGQPQGSKGLGSIATFTGAVLSSEGKRYEKIKLSELAQIGHQDPRRAEKYRRAVSSADGWVAMIQHYFIGAIVPTAGDAHILYTQYNRHNGDHIVGAKSERVTVAPGKRQPFVMTAYVGPKIVKNLEAVAPYLDKTVDYGMLFMISSFMFKIMEVVYGVIGNWGWAIVVVTLLIKLLFFVPSAWAYKSMAKMRALQPEMTRLREKYGDDRQAMGQEMMKLYRKEKVNPASGCLPMLLQIPFFIAFYYMLAESVELRQAPWLGWIKDLSALDPYFILPIINMALMFLQQRLNPPPADPVQQKVMVMMPLIFGFMFMWFPSGLVLYWTVSNAFGIVQQYVMNRRYGTPHKPHNQHEAAAGKS